MTSTIVALDLGTTHIRAVEAEIRKGKPPRIKKVYMHPLPENVITSGEITNEEDLTKALKEIWAKAKFSSKFVFAMAGGDTLDTRIKEVPWSSDEDLVKALSFYIKDDVILGDASEYYYGSHTLYEYFKPNDKNEDAPQQHMKTIFFTAVKRDYVDKFNRSVEAAGLRPYSMDILPLALIRSTSGTTDIPENANIVSIDIGGDVVTIVVHRNLQPVYVSTAPSLGGVRITSQIAQTLGISLVEAELLKTSFSMPVEMRKEQVVHLYSDNGEVTEISYQDFNNTQKELASNIISREVSNLVSYIGDVLEDAFSDSNPFRLVLSGGGAGLFTLQGRVQAELGVPTVISRPLENYNGKLPQDMVNNQHVYAALYGLIVGQDETK